VILIVGADGLIGRELYSKLKASGHGVRGTSRRAGSEHLHLDLTKPDDFAMPSGVEMTVVCAGMGDIAACDRSPAETACINVDGTVQIAKRAAESGSRVVALSSSLVFSGQGAKPRADDPVSPCCEYGRQKAAMESELAGKDCAIVRLTKVVETLRPRFSGWLDELKKGGSVRASAKLCFSPIALGETVNALCGLMEKFQPGIFHISGDESFSYHDAVVRVAEKAGASLELVAADTESGVDLFNPVPVNAALAPASPSDCSGWRFAPSSSTLAGFIRSL